MKGGIILGYRKLDNGRANVTGENILRFREESKYTQDQICAEFQKRGYSFYANDLYKIENAKRLVKDWELLILSLIHI